MSKIDFVQQATAPATPAASHVVMYAKTDDLMYYKDDAGVEHVLGPAIAALSAGSVQATNGTVVFSNSNGITFGMSGSTVTATVTSLSFANTNSMGNVTFGTSNASVVTAQVISTVSFLEIPSGGGAGLAANAVQASSNAPNLSFQRMIVPARMSATQLDFIAHLTVAGSTAGSFTASFAVYTLSKSTLSSVSSGSVAVTFNSGTSNAASIYGGQSGTRWRSIQPLVFVGLTPGEYMFGFAMSVAGVAGTTGSLTVYGQSAVSLNAAPGAADYTNYFADGIYSVGTGAWPASIHLSDINQTGANALRQPYIRLLGTF